MDKKIPKKNNSAADDLFSSLLEDVDGIDNLSLEESGPLVDTIYGSDAKVDESSENLFLNFDNRLEEKPNLIGSDSSLVEMGGDNFLDQIKYNLSPEHAGGVVRVNTDSSHEEFNETPEVPRENQDYTVPIKADNTELVVGESQHLSLPDVKQTNGDVDKTVAVTRFAQRQKQHINAQAAKENNASEPEEKVFLMTQKSGKINTSQISIDASLAQAENLRIAQNRILDLEKEIERLRQENDEILTAAEVIRNKSEEFTLKVSQLEKENQELKAEYKNESSLLKGNLAFKDSENQRLKEKIDELELRIKTDFKKIRVRERELENRLELMRAEKQAVAKSKDELLLELQRKNDISKSELETYRNKVQELNKTIESYQNQIKITVRTLRLALSHVEDKGDNQPIQYKKAT